MSATLIVQITGNGTKNTCFVENQEHEKKNFKMNKNKNLSYMKQKWYHNRRKFQDHSNLSKRIGYYQKMEQPSKEGLETEYIC